MSDDGIVEGFVPGGKATLGGVEVEVLGWARWRSADGWTWHEVTLRTADAERWTLELDSGHVLLFRQVPGEGYGEPPTATGHEVDLDGRARWTSALERGRLQKVEGEYWKDLEPGDRIEYRSYYAAPTTLSVSRKLPRGDWEWAEGVYLDPREVERAFELTLPRPTEPHPARPYPYRAWTRALGPVLAVVGVASLVASFALATGPGEVLVDEKIEAKDKKAESFVGVLDLEEAAIVGVQVAANGLRQSWAEVGALVGPVPPEGATPETFEPETVGRYVTELSYYEGVDSDGRWVESNLRASEGFRVGSGTWMMRLWWEIDPSHRGPVTFRVRALTGYREVTGLRVWGALALVGAGIFWILRRTHRQRLRLEAAGELG